MSDRPFFIVTGGAGFVGANLCAELQARVPEARILVIDDFRSGTFATLVEACERVAGVPFGGEVLAEPCGMLEWEDLISLGEPDAVFHMGAITDTTVLDEREMIGVNTSGFDEMVIACAGAGVPLVYASSAATYGTPAEAARREAFAEESAGAPNNVYGFSKWAMENVHRRFAEEIVGEGDEEPHIVGLRFFNVFGPGEGGKGKMASMAYQLGQQMLRGESPRLFAPGDQARDQVPVEDVVGCCIAAAFEGVRPGVYNLGSGRATSFNEVAQAVREGLGFSESERPVEYFEMPASIRTFYQDFTQADMSQTAEALNWSSQYDPIERLRAYGAWMREQAGQPAPAAP